MVTALGQPTTLGELVAQIHNDYQGSHIEPRALLATSIDADDTTVALASDPGELAEGSIIGIGLERMRVAAPPSGLSLTVQRGYGTQATAHTAGATVEVDWRWFTSDVVRELVAELESWPVELFQVRTLDVTVPTFTSFTDRAVEVTFTDYLAVLKVMVEDAGGVRDLTGDIQVETELPATMSSTGAIASFQDAYRAAGTMRITYASSYGTLVNATLDSILIDDLALPTRVHDIIRYGTLWRLLSNREPQRLALEAQGEPRRKDEVRALQSMQGGLAAKSLRDERMTEEISRLRNLYPQRF